MNITSKASITVSATLSAAEVFAAVYAVPGAVSAVLDAVQNQAVKDATGLIFVSRDAAAGEDGSVSVELVYEKAVTDTATPASIADPATPSPTIPSAIA